MRARRLSMRESYMENTLTWGEEYSQLKGLPTVQGYIRNNTFLSYGGWSEW